MSLHYFVIFCNDFKTGEMQINLKVCGIYHKLREARRYVTFSRVLLKDGNSLFQPQLKAVLSPVSFRLSRHRRPGKRLLLNVPIMSGVPRYSFRFKTVSLQLANIQSLFTFRFKTVSLQLANFQSLFRAIFLRKIKIER